MILVAGATGLVGGMITHALLQQGNKVRILTRDSATYRPLIDAGAEARPGDLKDPASLAAALKDIEVVITTASAGQRAGLDTPQSVDLDGNRNLIDAARAAGVQQFIFVSALSASEHSPVPISRFKAQTEAALRSSGIPYTIIAANAIMDVTVSLVVGEPIRTGKTVTLIREGRRQHSYVAACDIAAYAVAAVAHPAALNQRIPIGGPAALSWRDILATYQRVLGRTIPVQWIDPGELIPNLPPVPGLTELVSGLLAWLETFDSPLDMIEIADTFRVQPTTLEDFVNNALRRPEVATES